MNSLALSKFFLLAISLSFSESGLDESVGMGDSEGGRRMREAALVRMAWLSGDRHEIGMHRATGLSTSQRVGTYMYHPNYSNCWWLNEPVLGK